MTGTVLLTLGRLPKALDIARGFAALGWRVIVAEPFRWHLTGSSNTVARSYVVRAPAVDHARYLDDLALIIAAEKVSLVVPVSEETMHVAFLAARLGPDVRVFTVAPEAVLGLHSKQGFVAAAGAYGLRVPTTRRLDAGGTADRDVIVKPVFSCSGRGVRRIRRGEALPEPDPAHPAIIQDFIEGQEVSTCSIAHQGRALATVVYRGGIMSGSVAVSFERIDPSPALVDWIDRFIAGCGHSGFISFDLILDKDGVPYGIECNPRATSGVHFLDPASVAAAILDPAAAIRFRPERELQQFYSCLTAFFGFRDLGRILRTLGRARDVTWSLRDPKPFLLMTFTTWKIIWMAMRQGVPFGQVATLDVGWYDEDKDARINSRREPVP